METTATFPTSTRFTLEDLVLDADLQNLQRSLKNNRGADILEVGELQSRQILVLEKAQHDLQFTELVFSLRLASNLSSHEKSPFVQIWTSMIDQGVGNMGLAHKIQDIRDDMNPEGAVASLAKDRLIESSEAKRSYLIDGTIQVPIGDCIKHDGAIVSDFSHFTVSVPSSRALKSGETPAFSFEKSLPADATLHFQIHSNIGNSSDNDAYALTGTGQVSFARIATVVQDYIKHEKVSGYQGERNESDDPLIEISMMLNSVSAQDPERTIIDSVNKRKARKKHHGSLDPADSDEALYKGSLFLYVRTQIPQTRDFFTKGICLSDVSENDVTKGNFHPIADVLDMHVLRDMSPFIENYTHDLASITVKGRDGRTKQEGWEFQPSLPEGKNIHAPYYKVNGHTLPGYYYYHDKAMQRLPSAAFVLNIGKIVLARHIMTMKEFNRVANAPILKVLGDSDVHINPRYIKVLQIVGEITTSFSTSMNYRGDYADLNTDSVELIEEHLQDIDRIHHVVHASGMTRRTNGKHPSGYYTWDEELKVGTEAFGNPLMDRSGDCEDFAKLIVQMIAGVRSSKSTHPMILSIQSVLRNYTQFAVLGSVFGKKVSDGDEDEHSESSRAQGKRNAMMIGDIVVGSKEDLRSGIGAHMYGLLLPERNILRAVQSTSSRVQTLSDGSKLPEYARNKIAKEYLHKPLWEIGDSKHRSTNNKERPGLLRSSRHIPRERKVVVESSTQLAGPGLAHLNPAQLDAFHKRLPPLVLEGTGPSNALVNAVESYYGTLEDKKDAINETLYEVEAVTRLISSMPSGQVTSEAIRSSESVFKPFTMVISSNRLVDHLDVRISNFYRMLFEMYAIPEGNSDTFLVPPSIAHLHSSYKRSMHEEMTRKNFSGVERLSVSIRDLDKPSRAPEIYRRSKDKGASTRLDSKALYGMDRVFPVQLKQRTLSKQTLSELGMSEPREAHEMLKIHETISHVTYGVNMTDMSHQDENVGVIQSTTSLPREKRAIANVLVHTPPSPAFRLPPRREVEAAVRLASEYEKILSKDIDRTLSKGFFGHIQQQNLYVRTDNVQDRNIARMADYLANNPFARKVSVVAESFARGHHQIRIAIEMDVSGVKQLYLEPNTLSENLNKSDMKTVLRSHLEDLLA